MRRKLLPIIGASMLIICLIVACTDRAQVNGPASSTGDDPILSDPVVLTIDDTEPVAVVKSGANELDFWYDRSKQTLHYDCGDLHWELSPNQSREYTSRDELVIMIDDLGWPMRRETYVFNGQRLELLITGETATQEQIDQFLAFYEVDPNKNTLESNSDGEIMMRLLQAAEPQILAMWAERDPEGYAKFLLAQHRAGAAPMRPKPATYVCSLATACIAVKCWFGGLANAVCSACTGIVVACSIMDAFGWW